MVTKIFKSRETSRRNFMDYTTTTRVFCNFAADATKAARLALLALLLGLLNTSVLCWLLLICIADAGGFPLSSGIVLVVNGIVLVFSLVVFLLLLLGLRAESRITRYAAISARHTLDTIIYDLRLEFTKIATATLRAELDSREGGDEKEG